MAHPDSDYQTPRAGIPGVVSAEFSDSEFGPHEDKMDRLGKLIAERRADPTNGEESVYPDLLYAAGNPDVFGPGPALVQEPAVSPPGTFKQPTLRYGVDRQT